MGMEKYTPNHERFIVRKKYTTFITERIVALRSVNNIFPGELRLTAVLRAGLVCLF
jgi:hypothetical protein